MRRTGTDREQGATLVEYALGVALILLVCSIGISFAEGQGESKLSSRATGIGTPVENSAVRGGSGTGGGSGGGSTDSSVTADVTAAPSLVGSTTKDGSTWYATIVITVTDSSGNAVAGSIVTGDWNPDTASETASCTTSLSGTCTVTITNLDRTGQGSVDSVQFSISDTGVQGNPPGLYVNYSGGPTSLTLTKP